MSQVAGKKLNHLYILQLLGKDRVLYLRITRKVGIPLVKKTETSQNAIASKVESFTHSTITGFKPIRKCIGQLGREFHALHCNGIQTHSKMHSLAGWRGLRAQL